VLPKFLVKNVPKQKNIRKIRQLIGDSHLHTVCESASCPNVGECFSKNTLTFMILGNTCTRSCAFCGVGKGTTSPPDPLEPAAIAEAVKKLGLDYVVITSVTRDDLPDGGAEQFSKVIRNLRLSSRGGSAFGGKVSVPHTPKVEVLIPDFQGNIKSLQTVLDAKPYVLNHNIETVPRLYPKIRPQANYQQSLKILENAKKIDKNIFTKSGFMVGLGEDRAEIEQVLEALRGVTCDIVTIGQYLPPSRTHLKPDRYVEPAEFAEFTSLGEKMGFKKVFAGPFVRSSYHAGELIKCGKPKD